MAVRFPLYWDHGDGSLKSMTEAQRQEIVSAAIYEYGTQVAAGGNGVKLERVASGGNLGTITDQRFMAGAMTTHVSEFQPAQDKQAVIVNHDKINQTTSSTAYSGTYPLYYDGGNIKHMSQADFLDTFIHPAIDLLVDGTDRPGTFKVAQVVGAGAGNSYVDMSSIYTDTRADKDAYTADAAGLGSGSGEVQDQPTNIATWYLFRTDAGTDPEHKYPLIGLSGGSPAEWRELPPATFRTMLQLEITNEAVNSTTGYKIRYGYYDGTTHTSTGQNRGSGMIDTELDGQTDGQYQVDADDYRSQDFPAGSPTTVKTTYLRIRKE